ncbi:hypothetical protein IQ06DRAFT_362716 [Phaeosphaeriaceae sp. SRC1lsM3a]|nr:hypothetical protein IQ06DRAFT_362716 [Stagonospora sp. SRC1lsM3a]
MGSCIFTYDHRMLKTRLPVRSALFKQRTGGLVVKSVTISESPLLYVFLSIFFRSVDTLRRSGEVTRGNEHPTNKRTSNNEHGNTSKGRIGMASVAFSCPTTHKYVILALHIFAVIDSTL